MPTYLFCILQIVSCSFFSNCQYYVLYTAQHTVSRLCRKHATDVPLALCLQTSFPFYAQLVVHITFSDFLRKEKCLCTCSKRSVLPSTVKLTSTTSSSGFRLPFPRKQRVKLRWRADRPCHCVLQARAETSGENRPVRYCALPRDVTPCVHRADTGLYCPRPVTLSCLRA